VTTRAGVPAEVGFEDAYYTATITYDQYGQRKVEHESDTIEPIHSLRLTPRICEDGTIELDVEAKLTDVTGYVQGPGGKQNPVITTQSVATTVRVADGDTVMIAGLVSKVETGEGEDKSLRTVQRYILLTPKIIGDVLPPEAEAEKIEPQAQ